MKFELSQVEKERADKFYKKYKKKLKGEDVRISYHFYPSGIGNTVIIKSETLGLEEDITDLNNW